MAPAAALELGYKEKELECDIQDKTKTLSVIGNEVAQRSKDVQQLQKQAHSGLQKVMHTIAGASHAWPSREFLCCPLLSTAPLV
jgi:uncharacterized protein YoxC